MDRGVMVTGGAAGIGRAVARRFADAGWRVCAVDVDEAGLASLADDLSDDRHLVTPMDVRDGDAWHAVLDRFTATTGGQLHVLVNNAGVLRSGAFTNIPLEDHQRILDVNVRGVLTGCHAAHRHLRGTPGARVVNLASASAIYGQPDLASYSASKFAVRGLTEALDLEWADHDITVRALWPLFVDTAMIDGMATGATARLGVHLTARDVADAVFAVATDRPGRLGAVHAAVGLQARAFMAASQVLPNWAMRLVNASVTRG